MQSWPEGCVDMVFTDPPYGHNNNNNGDLIHRWEAALGHGPAGESRAIANDGAEASDLFRESLPILKRVLKRDGIICCCCGGGGGGDNQFARWSLWLDEVFNFKQMVVWDKGPMGMGWHYRRSYETVLVAQNGKGKCPWYDTTHAIENIIRPRAHGIRKIIPRATDHPTPKPWQLSAFFIGLHTQPGALVLDPFAGGGSTLEAAARLNRDYIGIELNPEYIQIAKDRIDKLHSEDKK
jgi:DNA modification methylase